MSSKDLKKLQNYRNEMKALDTELFSLLKKRIRLSQKIMRFKQNKNMPAQDPDREAEIEKQLVKKLGSLTERRRAHSFISALMRLNRKYLFTK